MKRRKTVNKYTVGENGQITNNQPKLSKRTRELLGFMGMMEVLGGYTSAFDGKEVEEENETVDTDTEDDVGGPDDDTIHSQV